MRMSYVLSVTDHAAVCVESRCCAVVLRYGAAASLVDRAAVPVRCCLLLWIRFVGIVIQNCFDFASLLSSGSILLSFILMSFPLCFVYTLDAELRSDFSSIFTPLTPSS